MFFSHSHTENSTIFIRILNLPWPTFGVPYHHWLLTTTMTYRIQYHFPLQPQHSPSKHVSRNTGSVQIMQQTNAIKVVGILFFLHTIKENANFVILNGFVDMFFKHRLTNRPKHLYELVLEWNKCNTGNHGKQFKSTMEQTSQRFGSCTSKGII